MGNRRRGHRSNWWTETTNGIYNWLGVVIVAVLVAASGAGAVALMERNAPVASNYTPPPVPAANDRPVALFIGDSYSFGARASDVSKRWTTIVSNALGWEEQNRAYSGTGYTTANAGVGTCGAEYCPRYDEVIREFALLKPDVVIISGGRNDGGLKDGYGEAVAGVLTLAKETWPDAELVVTSPLWDDEPLPNAIADSIEVVQDEANALGVRYIDLGQPLTNRGDAIDADGVHPNDLGYQIIADDFLAAWS